MHIQKMKKIFDPVVNFVLKLFYRDFNLENEDYPKKTLLVYGIRQRIFGYNRHVPWPVHPSSVIKSPEKIIRGTKAPGFAKNCYIDGRNGIHIEENVWIANGVSIISMNHNMLDYSSYENSPPVIIRKNSLLSANCIILPGVELGEHTIVGAGSVVTKSFPEGNRVIAGNPATIIRQIDEYSVVQASLE